MTVNFEADFTEMAATYITVQVDRVPRCGSKGGFEEESAF
jgi:hypothetical protein